MDLYALEDNIMLLEFYLTNLSLFRPTPIHPSDRQAFHLLREITLEALGNDRERYQNLESEWKKIDSSLSASNFGSLTKCDTAPEIYDDSNEDNLNNFHIVLPEYRFQLVFPRRMGGWLVALTRDFRLVELHFGSDREQASSTGCIFAWHPGVNPVWGHWDVIHRTRVGNPQQL